MILILQNFLVRQTVAVLEIVIHPLENVHVILEDLEKIVQLQQLQQQQQLLLQQQQQKEHSYK